MKGTKLATTSEQFDRLHEALDRTRKGTKTVNVPRDDLADILRDHSTMVALLKLDT